MKFKCIQYLQKKFKCVETDDVLIFNLSPTGNGQGVAILTWEVSEDAIAILDGNARFYSNPAGTLNESTSFIFLAGALRTRYIRLSSGTATLKIKNVVIKWGVDDEITSGAGWWTDQPGLNYPSIEINIAKMTHITSLNLFGNNTIYGDCSNLPLTYIEIGNGVWVVPPGDSFSSPALSGIGNGGCVIHGDASKLTNLFCLDAWDATVFTGNVENLTKLEIIWLGGYNTISGDVSKMNPHLRYLDCDGYNTLSGSITGMFQLTKIRILGYNTITGSVDGMVNLKWLEVGGFCNLSGDVSLLTTLEGFSADTVWGSLYMPHVLNTPGLYYFVIRSLVLTDTFVNEILADFRVNKDMPKNDLVTRGINLDGLPGSSPPTGQGLIDKAMLMTYRSPGNNPIYPVWLVQTR